MTTLPTVPETLNGTPFASDIFSNLLQHNILFLNGPVTQDSASLICSSLLYLSSKDETQPISLYINSPGGDITAGLAIIDMMQMIPNPVATIGTGQVASMASVILSSGTKGMRSATSHCRIMLHEASLSFHDASLKQNVIHTLLDETELLNNICLDIYAETTGQNKEKIRQDLNYRDFHMSSEEAVSYGLIDRIQNKLY